MRKGRGNRPFSFRDALAVVLTCALSACAGTTDGIRTQFFGSYPFSATERRTIARIAGAAAVEARRHLPALAPHITLEVHSGKDVIPELGAIAVAGANGDWIRWTVDPDHPEGVVKIAEAHLRGALFHEFHHLVRGTTHPTQTLIDQVVFEGMATAFERDFAGVSRPWGQYPDHVWTWVDELLKLPPGAKRGDWLSHHPDGGRWVDYKTGTFLVDRAMKQLNRSSADLVATPAQDIVAAASVKPEK